MSASDLKAIGNEQSKKGNLQSAVLTYGEALQVVNIQTPDLRRDLHRNRAEAHLQLGHYDPAKEDAISSLIHAGDPRSKQLDAKAFLRAARALNGLGECRDATRFIDSSSHLCLTTTMERVLRKKTSARMNEEANGDYSFNAILDELSADSPRVDVADYARKTNIRM